MINLTANNIRTIILNNSTLEGRYINSDGEGIESDSRIIDDEDINDILNLVKS